MKLNPEEGEHHRGNHHGQYRTVLQSFAGVLGTSRSITKGSSSHAHLLSRPCLVGARAGEIGDRYRHRNQNDRKEQALPKKYSLRQRDDPGDRQKGRRNRGRGGLQQGGGGRKAESPDAAQAEVSRSADCPVIDPRDAPAGFTHQQPSENQREAPRHHRSDHGKERDERHRASRRSGDRGQLLDESRHGGELDDTKPPMMMSAICMVKGRSTQKPLPNSEINFTGVRPAASPAPNTRMTPASAKINASGKYLSQISAMAIPARASGGSSERLGLASESPWVRASIRSRKIDINRHHH